MSTEREVQNNYGKVKVTYGNHPPGQRHYTPMTYEGPREAVFIEVGRHLMGVTRCYEHMFSVQSIENLGPYTIRVNCMANSYAGD